MNRSPIGKLKFVEDMTALLILIALGCTVSGCAASKDAPSQSTAVSTATAKPAPAMLQSGITAGQTLRELSVREERGQTVILVKFAQPITQFRHFPLTQPARIVLDIAVENKAPTSTDTFRIDTSIMSVLRSSAGENNLRLVMEIAAATVPVYNISQEDGGLKIVVGAVDSNANVKKNVLLVKDGQRLDARSVQASVPPSPDGKILPAASDDRVNAEKTFTGQKISLEFKDADIKNIFRLLAEVSGLNIVVTADVNRRVTLRLLEVPWDQAMDLIITTNGLEKEHIGNVVRISTADALKGERDKLVAAKESREKLDPMHTAYYTVNYAKAKELEAKVRPLMSKRSDAALVIDERSNTIMVRDIQKSVDDVNALIAKLDTRTPQVLIESNLIETTPSFSRALGFQLGFSRGGFTFDGINAAALPFSASGTPTPLGAALSVIQKRVGGFTDLTARLTAAEQEGNIKIISRPSVVTLNNVASTIQSLEIIRVALPSSTNIASGSGSAAGTAVATEKIPVGIILSVTPQVSSDGFILMNINVKSSSLGERSPGAAVPNELSREAISNVLVRDGETIVIGGIMKDTAKGEEGGVPYLKEIPVLGWLFKNTHAEKKFEELMVFITPRIIAAGSENIPSAEALWREQMKMTEGAQPVTSQTTP